MFTNLLQLWRVSGIVKNGVFHIFGEDMFFLGLSTPACLNHRFRLNRLSSPPDLGPGIGTEHALLSD
jgi:hypothetical protein